MVKYCPHCGRSMPEDGNRCPYCGRLVAKHEGITVGPPEELQKKSNTGLIIAVVLIVLIIVPIAIAATVYVYVSGMISDPPSMQTTPNISAMITPDSGNNATLFITYIEDDYVYWSEVSFELYDITDGETLTKYSDYTTDTSYGNIENGDSIKFTGKGEEFQENHKYRATLIYSITDGIMFTYTWTQ